MLDKRTYWVLRVTYENGLTAELAEQSGKPRKVKEKVEAASAHERAQVSPHRVVSVEREEVEKRPLSRNPVPFRLQALRITERRCPRLDTVAPVR